VGINYPSFSFDHHQASLSGVATSRISMADRSSTSPSAKRGVEEGPQELPPHKKFKRDPEDELSSGSETEEEIAVTTRPTSPQSSGQRFTANEKGKGKEVIEILDDDEDLPIEDKVEDVSAGVEKTQPISEYNCPICFSPPTAATLTPCGHVMCGSCLFASVRTSLTRARNLGMGGDALQAKCPVCRNQLKGWDGRGGGVIGLRPKLAPAR